MEVLSGTASYVRRTASVYGDQGGFGTDQIVTLRIGSQAVELAMASPPMIEGGTRWSSPGT